MALRDLVGNVTDSSSVRRVFGDPIEKDGVLVIPVATIRGAWGGGEGDMAAGGRPAGERPGTEGEPRAEGERPDAKPNATAWGGGGAWSAGPAGAYVVKNGDVTWVPAMDANRTAMLGMLTGIVSLLVLRSIVRTVAKRR
jgi:uncharacterized spore protein YtfJ